MNCAVPILIFYWRHALALWKERLDDRQAAKKSSSRVPVSLSTKEEVSYCAAVAAVATADVLLSWMKKRMVTARPRTQKRRNNKTECESGLRRSLFVRAKEVCQDSQSRMRRRGREKSDFISCSLCAIVQYNVSNGIRLCTVRTARQLETKEKEKGKKQLISLFVNVCVSIQKQDYCVCGVCVWCICGPILPRRYVL
ncbi:hypothetical protein GQ42DRAFT_82634 [Ramicandelaber brevisporus]|nr:hypothetical protein GQ42DRAFT_82634 [Ramicandelaber brevisporus]